MSRSFPVGEGASLGFDNCTCAIGCDTTTTATQRKMNVLKKSTSSNMGQSKAMRYASYSNTTPGLHTVGNKKQVFVSAAPSCRLPNGTPTSCMPNVGDWNTATKNKFAWLTGCPLACNGHNQTNLDNAAFRYNYPQTMFGRFSNNPYTSAL
jgi:hypothetical protein